MTLKVTSERTGAFLLRSNSMVEDTRDDSEPASLGAGDVQALLLAEPKPESLNMSLSRISFGSVSKPLRELSKLEED